MTWAFEFVEVRSADRVLDGVSFGTRVGDTTALVGPTGCGKTLAFRLLIGLDRADEGAVVVAGKDMGRSSARVRRRLQRRLAVVFQAPGTDGYALFDAIDVLENVTFPMREVGRVPRRRITAVALEVLERFGLAEHARARPADLDRDARKRLALARALALRSPLLVVDALEDGLRPDSVPVVAQALHDLGCEDGTSVLVTTRDPALACALTRHVVDLAPRHRVAGAYGRSPSALTRR